MRVRRHREPQWTDRQRRGRRRRRVRFFSQRRPPRLHVFLGDPREQQVACARFTNFSREFNAVARWRIWFPRCGGAIFAIRQQREQREHRRRRAAVLLNSGRRPSDHLRNATLINTVARQLGKWSSEPSAQRPLWHVAFALAGGDRPLRHVRSQRRHAGRARGRRAALAAARAMSTTTPSSSSDDDGASAEQQSRTGRCCA